MFAGPAVASFVLIAVQLAGSVFPLIFSSEINQVLWINCDLIKGKNKSMGDYRVWKRIAFEERVGQLVPFSWVCTRLKTAEASFSKFHLVLFRHFIQRLFAALHSQNLIVQLQYLFPQLARHIFGVLSQVYFCRVWSVKSYLPALPYSTARGWSLD